MLSSWWASTRLEEYKAHFPETFEKLRRQPLVGWESWPISQMRFFVGTTVYLPYMKGEKIDGKSRWWQLAYFWNFHPETWGRFPFWLVFFLNGLKLPTSKYIYIYIIGNFYEFLSILAILLNGSEFILFASLAF